MGKRHPMVMLVQAFPARCGPISSGTQGGCFSKNCVRMTDEEHTSPEGTKHWDTAPDVH